MCASNEELSSELVQEAFHEFDCGIRKGKVRKDEVRTMTVKVVELMHICKEHKVLITTMEKEVKDILDLIVRRNSISDDTPSQILEFQPLPVDHTDFKKPESSDEDVAEDKDILEDKDLGGDEDWGNEEHNMFANMKRETRKSFKTVVMRTPWTTYSRKKGKSKKFDA